MIVLVGACAQRGPEGLELAAHTYLKLPRELVFVPPEAVAKLSAVRPGASLLGAVLTPDETPRMLLLYDGGVDARGLRKVELVGWDDAPGARSLVRERLLARARN
ncbi:MAG TPA: hypothetical protein VNU64_19610 [Burkholderiales bacterium]|nr:hypothetical protein [Burkholderiales bacterium]